MIIDSDSNKLYVSDLLSIRHPKFYKEFESLLNKYEVNFELLPNTKDIWAVDYMPIQIETNKFVQFVYDPDYLHKWNLVETISDVNSICEAIHLPRKQSDIVLDGGNVIKAKDSVIMCDKVFKANSTHTKNQLIEELKKQFEVDKLFFIPQQPYDEIGHADGMIRFLDDNTVLINDYSRESPFYQKAIKNALAKMGLNVEILPYNPYNNKDDNEANGIYINYLQMENVIVVPVFGMKEDEKVVKKFEEFFRGQPVATIYSNEVAIQGGVLNCITWNIKI